MIIKYLSPAGLRKLISKMKAAFSEKNHNHQLSDLSGTVPVNKGGTGATEAAQARTNLGVTPQNIGAMPTGGGTFSGNITVSKTDPYVSLENTGTNNKFGFHVYGTEGGKGTLALYDHIKAKHVFNVYSYSEKVTFEWPVDLLSALAIESGGTGANNAAGARANLGITPGNIGAAPTSHTHSAGNITSGVISIERGGTGASDAATARVNLGALATSGGPITGYLQFGTMSNGLEWFTADGTQIHLRPYAPGNSFQITLKGPNTDDQETGAFNISTTGYVTLGRPLGIESGGTGANNAAGARNNLSVPELRNSVVIVNNQKGLGTNATAGQYWQLWNLEDDTNPGTYPAAFAPSQNGKQNMGAPGFYIKKVYANTYSGGLVDGGMTFQEETLFRKRIYVDKNDGIKSVLTTGNNPKFASVYLDINGTWTNALTLYEDKSTLTKPLSLDSGGLGRAFSNQQELAQYIKKILDLYAS